MLQKNPYIWEHIQSVLKGGYVKPYRIAQGKTIGEHTFDFYIEPAKDENGQFANPERPNILRAFYYQSIAGEATSWPDYEGHFDFNYHDLKDKTLDDFQQMIARKECSLSTSRGKSEMAKMNEPFKEVSFTPEEKRKISTMLDDMMPYWKQVQAESGNPNEYSDCIEAGNILRYQLARDPIMFSEKEENQILDVLDDMMNYWVDESSCPEEYLDHIEAGAILYGKFGYEKEGKKFLDDARKAAGVVAEEREPVSKDDSAEQKEADAAVSLSKLAQPETQDAAIQQMTDFFLQKGMNVDQIDELFSKMKMTAISRAEEVGREGPAASNNKER